MIFSSVNIKNYQLAQPVKNPARAECNIIIIFLPFFLSVGATAYASTTAINSSV